MILLISQGDGRIVEANPAAVHFYGYTHDALCSLRIHDVNRRPPADIEQDVAAAFREVQDRKMTSAMYLFNRACFYPLAVCGVVAVLVIV